MPRRARRFYEFGSFRLDPQRRRLFRNGEAVPLGGKAIEALLLLVQHPNKTVERETFMDAIWPETLVEDANLTVAISQVRNALSGDAPSDYIETVPRMGYRFVGDVRQVREESPERATEEKIGTAEEVEKLVLQGRYQWNKRQGPAVKKSIEFYEQAVEIDPMCAPAWAGLADSYMLLGFLGTLPPTHAFPKAKAAAKRANELDPSAPEPMAALGYVSSLYEYKPLEGLDHYDTAIRLDPNYAWAHHWRGVNALSGLGRFDEAMASVRQAEDLDPLSQVMSTAPGVVHYFARRYDAAIKVYRRVIETATTFAPGYFYLGMALEQLGRMDEAIEQLRESHRLGLVSLALGALGHALARAGRRDEAHEVITQLQKLSESQYISPYAEMLIHVGLGDRPAALIKLEEALEQRESWLLFVHTDARMDGIRQSPEGGALLGKYGLQR